MEQETLQKGSRVEQILVKEDPLAPITPAKLAKARPGIIATNNWGGENLKLQEGIEDCLRSSGKMMELGDQKEVYQYGVGDTEDKASGRNNVERSSRFGDFDGEVWESGNFGCMHASANPIEKALDAAPKFSSAEGGSLGMRGGTTDNKGSYPEGFIGGVKLEASTQIGLDSTPDVSPFEKQKKNSRKTKKSAVEVNKMSQQRSKVKKHRPKIFDASMPKMIPKPKNETKPKKIPKPKNETRKVTRNVKKSGNALQSEIAELMVPNPQTPDWVAPKPTSPVESPFEGSTAIRKSSFRTSGDDNGQTIDTTSACDKMLCCKTLDFNVENQVEDGNAVQGSGITASRDDGMGSQDFLANAAEGVGRHEIVEDHKVVFQNQYRTYTEGKSSLKLDFDFNLKVQDFGSSPEMREILYYHYQQQERIETSSNKRVKDFPKGKRGMRFRKASQCPLISLSPYFWGNRHMLPILKHMLPTVKHICDAIRDPKSFNCMLALQPKVKSRKKRSNRQTSTKKEIAEMGKMQGTKVEIAESEVSIGIYPITSQRRKQTKTYTKRSRHCLSSSNSDLSDVHAHSSMEVACCPLSLNSDPSNVENASSMEVACCQPSKGNSFGAFEEVLWAEIGSSIDDKTESSLVNAVSENEQLQKCYSHNGNNLNELQISQLEVDNNLHEVQISQSGNLLQAYHIQGSDSFFKNIFLGVQTCLYEDVNPQMKRQTLQQEHENVVYQTKSGGLNNSKMKDLIDSLIKKLCSLSINDECMQLVVRDQSANSALVPYNGKSAKKGKVRKVLAKVDLDPESSRQWKLWQDNGGSEAREETDEDKKKWWQEEKKLFEWRILIFSTVMNLVQGNRRFSQWQGSVVDSVVGVYLTQNVSDRLSSSAFMSLAAKYPIKSEHNSCDGDGSEGFSLSQESVGSNVETEGPINVSDSKQSSSFQIEENHQSAEKKEEKEENLVHIAEDVEVGLADLLGASAGNPTATHMQSTTKNYTTSSTLDILQEFENYLGYDSSLVDMESGVSQSGKNSPSSSESSASVYLTLSHNPSSRLPFLSSNCNSDSIDHVGDVNNKEIEEARRTSENHGCENAFASQTIIHDKTAPRVEDETTADCYASLHQSEVSTNGNFKETIMTETNKQQSERENKSRKKRDEPEEEQDGEREKSRNKRKLETPVNWDDLRKTYFTNMPRSANTQDSVDWEAVRRAPIEEVWKAIEERGQHRVIAKRIQDFLNRLVTDHGSIDLEWLRDVPPHKAKEFLLSIPGLGLKSVECVRLLTLRHDDAFPVDTNVGRIAVRLGWVPLQPLPGSLEIHLLDQYPPMDKIQQYLIPRVKDLGREELYELHYHMITFGKVFCSKKKPNCTACPMRGKCKHYASAYASANLCLPRPEDKGIVRTKGACAGDQDPTRLTTPPKVSILDSTFSESRCETHSCEPIVEHPASPGPMLRVASERDIEDICCTEITGLLEPSGTIQERESEDICYTEMPPSPGPSRITQEIDTEGTCCNEDDGIRINRFNAENAESFKNFFLNYVKKTSSMYQNDEISKAMVALTPEAASIPMPKLRSTSRLRTVHSVYELEDTHPLLAGFEKREPADPCPYLFAIWMTGINDCSSNTNVEETDDEIVRGTILIPCRTANRGSFPLNGTYFQTNEVFADYESSQHPITAPRKLLWDKKKRSLYCGTSATSIFRGVQLVDVARCFWAGFICVRGFDRRYRAPRPLPMQFHRTATGKKQED